MKQELEAILSFGAQAVSGAKTVFDEAAGRSLDRLIQGNSGYKEISSNPAELTQTLREATMQNGQSPLAVVVCCSDSRVPPEHIFHAGIGELFVIRNAGNLISQFALGSAEYAVEHLGTPLVLLMGHTNCGAVSAALTPTQETGGLADILAEIRSAIGPELDPRTAERKNALHALATLGRSPILQALPRQGKVEFAAAIYDIRTGHVDFLQDDSSPP